MQDCIRITASTLLIRLKVYIVNKYQYIQYLNLFYNYGLLGFLSYVMFQISVLWKLYYGKTFNSKVLFVFCLWLFFIAFNLTAYLYRSNVTIFFFIMLMYTFNLEKKNIK